MTPIPARAMGFRLELAGGWGSALWYGLTEGVEMGMVVLILVKLSGAGEGFNRPPLLVVIRSEVPNDFEITIYGLTWICEDSS